MILGWATSQSLIVQASSHLGKHKTYHPHISMIRSLEYGTVGSFHYHWNDGRPQCPLNVPSPHHIYIWEHMSLLYYNNNPVLQDDGYHFLPVQSFEIIIGRLLLDSEPIVPTWSIFLFIISLYSVYLFCFWWHITLAY